ncbi:MAG: DNA polymerase III subunit beta [Bacteroidetes bacterium]|nr:DNA polymerase III subunit beta [Bacteroidota bacterium]MBT5528911.1 DNA polymerase III subunit beta [Cytophagia bacterium]MBT3423899.1 DNA polymerase III subunit beta [Bacteroidota bacterium]MBT3800927.1 DNA polymerase III subunit beta [Bacteroidota bacterium]MBT3934498.1 DNA polymerase III subunit beta [Bacteroidota bacterium]
MKFIASTGTLLKQLQIINGVISSKVVIPILEYFLFEVDNEKLRIVGTDLEVSIQGSIPVESKEAGKIAIPAKMIIDILKTLPEQPITFTINEDNNSIELKSDNGKYKITGEVAEDFPKFPVLEDATEFKLSSSIMQDAINNTFFAVGNDELKPALTGLFIDMGSDDITFVSTDGNKLVKFKKSNIGIDQPTSFILPRKALNVLKASNMGSDEDEIEVQFNKVNALFKFQDTTIVCRLIDERFPDYNSAIPVELPNRMTINRHDLIDSLKRIQIFANKTTYQVRFNITGNELQLTSQDLDYANEAHERLSCEYAGEDMEIGFSARFLIEMLSSADSDEIVLSLTAHNRPGTITPATHADDEELIMLLMPIVIKFN